MKNTSLFSWFQGIKGRLLLAAFLPVIGFVVILAVAISSLNSTTKMITSAHESLIPNIQFISEMRQSRNKFAYRILEAVAYGENPEVRAKDIANANEAIKEFSENYDKYTKASFLPGEEALHDKAKSTVPEFIGLMKSIVSLIEANDPAKTKQAGELMETKFSSVGKVIRDFNVDVDRLYDKQSKLESAMAKSITSNAFNMMVLVAATAAAVIFAVLLWIAAQISKSVGGIADSLKGASTQVATAVEQLNEAGNGLSHSSTEAAASLEETVASLEELTSMVQMNSDNAKQAAALSISSREAAEVGENEIKTLITSMTEISRSSKKIEEIISVIDDIAFQTNLLALNAAVEAARAGEQGKGFAVVAEAVRTLAQRSAASAKDINSLIKESVAQIERGSEIADQSGTVLSNIVNSIKKVSDLNSEIAAASSEQTAGIQQISKAMNQMDQSSQSNAASAEEIAATSSEIASLATNTLNLTIDLNKVILGSGAASHEPAELATASPAKAAKPVAKKANVIPFKKPAERTASKATPAPSSQAIPFDEDDRAKVGNTDGF